MREIISRKPSIWLLSIIIALMVGVAYFIDDMCYQKEQELTLRLASSSMIYAQEIISNKGEIFRIGDDMYVGEHFLNQDSTIVDLVKEKTGFGCTIFRDSTRISTTATEKGFNVRALGTHANAEVTQTVFKNGGTFRGITHTIGKDWVIVYTPLRDIDQHIVGMLATYIELDDFVDSMFHFRLFSSLVFISLVILILSYSLRNRRINRSIENKAIDEIKLRNDELTEVNKALDAFVYRASHDLRAPIVNMKSMLKMLNNVVQIEKDSTAEQVLGNLNQSANDLEMIIKDLLEISRIERRPEEKEVGIDLKVLMDDLIWNMSNLIKEHNGSIQADFSECPKIVAPPTTLRSVLTNLINNSFKYRSPNRDPKVTVKSFIQNDKSCLSIVDNGVGMNIEKYGDKLFEMFSRLHPHLETEGSGVGLHIVKKMLDSIGARIELESSVDKGTKFLIIFKN